MSEMAPQQNTEYLQQHPNAVEDQAKAEVMAHASKDQEEIVVDARAKALNAASNLGSNTFRDDHNRGPVHSAERYAEEALTARKVADSRALGAAAIYDRVKHL